MVGRPARRFAVRRPPRQRILAGLANVLDDAEGGVELTYADTFGPFTIQPDLQWIYNPGGDANRDAILIAGLRVNYTLR